MGKGETNILRGRQTDRQTDIQAGRPSNHADRLFQKEKPETKSAHKRLCCFVFILFFNFLILGDSGGVVNSLEVFPASLKSLGCFYFRCVLASQWKVTVTVNLRILHCQLSRHFWRPVVRMCLATSNDLLLVL